MYSQETVLELVDLIYAAAGDPAQWDTLLLRLAGILQGSAASLHHQHHNSQEANVASSWQIDAQLIGEYVQHYSRVNPIFTLGKNLIRQGAVYPRQALCPDDVLLHSEFYVDYLQRLKVFQGAIATIMGDTIASANLTIYRPRSAPAFGTAECELLSVLTPHLQRAFQLHTRIQALERKGSAATDALDQLSRGIVLLDLRGRVLLVNRAANAIFATEKMLKITPRGLEAVIPSENRRLNAMIRGAIATGDGKGLHAGGTIAVSRDGLRRPLQLLITPLRTRTIYLGKDVPVIAVFISDADSKPVSEAQAFSQLYGLTTAESRLALMLAAGHSLKQTAEQFGVAQSTLRSHLKSIFAKTDTNRQSQLVRLVLSGTL